MHALPADSIILRMLTRWPLDGNHIIRHTHTLASHDGYVPGTQMRCQVHDVPASAQAISLCSTPCLS